MLVENVKRDENIKYKDVRFTFVQDYDRCNPMSANKARAKYLIAIQEKQAEMATDEERKKIAEELKTLQAKSSLNSILDYTAMSKGLEISKVSKINKNSASSKDTNNGQKKLANKFMGKLKRKEENNEENKNNAESKFVEAEKKLAKGITHKKVAPINTRMESMNDDKSEVHLREELKDI